MKNIQIGDRVEAFNTRTGATVWSPVMSFLHREPETMAQYLVLGYTHPVYGYGAVTCSADHLLFCVERGDMAPAAQITPGNHLKLCNNTDVLSVEVTGVMNVTEKGVYAPLTNTGTLVVDGIVASCYVDAGFSQRAVHKAFKPLRVLGEMKPDLVANRGGNIHWYARGLQRIADKAGV